MTDAGAADALLVDGIAFRTIIGVTPRERRRPQRVVVSLRLVLDFRAVRRSDAIRDTVDYRAVARRVLTVGRSSRFQLIERLAAHLGAVVLAHFPAVRSVRVEVEKPGALREARTVRAAITSRRGQEKREFEGRLRLRRGAPSVGG